MALSAGLQVSRLRQVAPFRASGGANPSAGGSGWTLAALVIAALAGVTHPQTQALVSALLRAQRLDRQDVVPANEVEQHFEVRIVCRGEDEIQVRSLMLHSLGDPQLRLQSLQSQDLDNPARLEVRAELLGTAQAPAQLERLVSRVSLEKGVSSVRWQLQPQVLATD